MPTCAKHTKWRTTHYFHLCVTFHTAGFVKCKVEGSLPPGVLGTREISFPATTVLWPPESVVSMLQSHAVSCGCSDGYTRFFCWGVGHTQHFSDKTMHNFAYTEPPIVDSSK